jgi:uncharacterized protein
MLTGVIHLPALPGSPGSMLSAREIAKNAASDARVLFEAGFDACIVENFGDAPFPKDRSAEVTVSALTVCALAVRDAFTRPLGINVLRNDAAAALGIAAVVDAEFVRINVHMGARLTDQGIIEGKAAETLRLRHALGAQKVAIWADVDVKHSAPLAPVDLVQETEDLVKRGLVSAVLVTGSGTGHGVQKERLMPVVETCARLSQKGFPCSVHIASGATVETLAELSPARGIIVGSALRASGMAGGAIDATKAREFVSAYRRMRA